MVQKRLADMRLALLYGCRLIRVIQGYPKYLYKAENRIGVEDVSLIVDGSAEFINQQGLLLA